MNFNIEKGYSSGPTVVFVGKFFSDFFLLIGYCNYFFNFERNYD